VWAKVKESAKAMVKEKETTGDWAVTQQSEMRLVKAGEGSRRQ